MALPKVKEELAASGFSGNGFALHGACSNGTYRVSHGASFLAPRSLARRRLARAIHHHLLTVFNGALLSLKKWCDQSPGRRKFCLASGGCKLEPTRPWLGLVGLSRIPSGTFFFRCTSSRKWPAKMTKTRQNENENFQTMTNRDDS